ncbi:hypothetical protein GGS23DRAFT_353344 [Durotheca rogersii]|uniref:uncharacterized protein n=1 Tax=Durotheca rogersii TaxID=419775 RepID=UPI00221FB5D3|nr:uncharacterized protein GGS23DRAFT_353344 [Durotheca rogersii]KAI5865750.1 hypothetical protein GGS23DRAFT_353344 [Durotheca rogersii]
MLRLLRSRPNLFSLASRVHAARGVAESAGPQPHFIQVHRVNIRRKWFRPRNIIIAGCIYYVCYRVYKASVLGTLGAWVDEQEKELTTSEREELEEELLEPLFIPLPFTTKAVPSPPYRYSDPEWKTFVRVSKNKDQMRAIQGSLAEIVRKMAVATPELTQRCGRDMKLGRYWLDIQYPPRPPPTFVRKGICIDSDSIYVGEQPVDSLVVFRTQRALWPSALTVSLWSFSEALMKQNALYIAKLFGLEPTPSPPLQQAVDRIQQKWKKPSTSFPSASTQTATDDGDGGGGGSTTDAEPPAEKQPPAPDAGAGGALPLPPGAEPGKPKGVRDIYIIRHTQEHTSGAWQAFKQTFAQTWRPIRDLPPRGSIYVSGLVEVTTSRCFLTIDAAAFWDPKTENFDMKTATFRLRTLRLRTQTAAR